MQSREEYLQSCKDVAMRYVDRGEYVEGITSMLSDLTKHPETESAEKSMAVLGMLECMNPTREGAERFIKGFR